MSIDCSDVPAGIAYNCSNPWGQGCTSSQVFNFANLWSYTQNIQKACANDDRLFGSSAGLVDSQKAALTLLACTAIAGSSWGYYPGADIWSRLTSWKFPLLQLVASFPRPPLNFWVEMFVVNHLLGDPVDTIKGLLSKMSDCQAVAEYWRTKLGPTFGTSLGGEVDRHWKAWAIITDAYAECGEEGLAKEMLFSLMDFPNQVSTATIVWQSANALAADRATKSLGIVVAQCIYIASVAIAIFRTAAAADSRSSSDTVFINVEAHSIAFSALYYWIIPAVFLSSIIGVSQTEAAIPRILERFETDLIHSGLLNGKMKSQLRMLNNRLADTQRRTYHGGIYSWHRLEWHRLKRQRETSGTLRHTPCVAVSSHDTTSEDIPLGQPLPDHVETALTPEATQNSKTLPRRSYWRRHHLNLPYFIVISGAITGMTVSALVPPDGIACRHIAQLAILVIWLVSAELDILLHRIFPLTTKNQKPLFWCTYAKDLIATCTTMGGIIATQIGLFNRCSCYTQWGRTGLSLPEMPDVAAVLRKRLGREYPAIIFTSIAIQILIVPLAIWLWYGDAMRVFVQRDDNKSNATWLWRLSRIRHELVSSTKTIFCRLCRKSRWSKK